MALTLEIVMPGWREEILHVKTVVFQTPEGEVGILPGHLPMISLVDIGVLSVTTADQQRRFVTGQGLAQITGNHVRLLLQDLIAENDIDEEAALRSLDAASKAVSLPDYAGFTAGREERMKEVRFAEAQLSLLGSRHPR
jgi:F-type H+-transporting ATPase subunit epsilon